MKIRPLQDRVLVKRVEEEQKTKGGIIIPDTAKEMIEREDLPSRDLAVDGNDARPRRFPSPCRG